jgi:hypothetical protein
VTLYRQCPHRFYKTRITKEFKDVFKGPAAEWGTAVHRAMERRVRLGTELPANMSQYETLAAKLEDANGEIHCELKMALNEDRQPVEYFARDVWVRIIIDLLILNLDTKTAIVFDYKTGKRKDDDRQLAICALGVFNHWPEIERVVSGFIWMSEGCAIDKCTFQRKHEERLWNLYTPFVTNMEQSIVEGNWPTKPSGLCNGWCPVSDCQFWQPKRG